MAFGPIFSVPPRHPDLQYAAHHEVPRNGAGGYVSLHQPSLPRGPEPGPLAPRPMPHGGLNMMSNRGMHPTLDLGPVNPRMFDPRMFDPRMFSTAPYPPGPPPRQPMPPQAPTAHQYIGDISSAQIGCASQQQDHFRPEFNTDPDSSLHKDAGLLFTPSDGDREKKNLSSRRCKRVVTLVHKCWELAMTCNSGVYLDIVYKENDRHTVFNSEPWEPFPLPFERLRTFHPPPDINTINKPGKALHKALGTDPASEDEDAPQPGSTPFSPEPVRPPMFTTNEPLGDAPARPAPGLRLSSPIDLERLGREGGVLPSAGRKRFMDFSIKIPSKRIRMASPEHSPVGSPEDIADTPCPQPRATSTVRPGPATRLPAQKRTMLDSDAISGHRHDEADPSTPPARDQHMLLAPPAPRARGGRRQWISPTGLRVQNRDAGGKFNSPESAKKPPSKSPMAMRYSLRSIRQRDQATGKFV